MFGSAKLEYACKAMVILALRSKLGRPTKLAELARSDKTPQKYLEGIMLQLKSSGLVLSIRGAQGGYQLAKRPEEISLADVLESLSGPTDSPSVRAKANPVESVLDLAKKQASQAGRKVLEETNLHELASRVQAGAQAMYYI